MAKILITDAEERSVLAATRALDRAGHTVAAVGRGRASPTLWSRACSERHVLPDPRLDSEQFLAGLERLVERGAYDALVPGSDVSLLVLSEGRHRLEPHTRLGLPTREVVRACGDKAALIEVSRDAGLPPPMSAVCRDSAQAADAARRIGYPVIVKPARSALSDGTIVSQRPTRVVHAEHELPAATSDAGGAMLVQRFERPRAHLSCGGVATDEGVAAFAVARFHRTWPVQSGAAAFAETVDAPPGLREKVHTLVERIGWRGIFELEVLALDGDRFCAIDFNPRVFGWLGLAVEAGADLPDAMIEALLRGRTVAARSRAGVRYRWEDADVCHAAWQLRRGRVRAAGRVLRPARGVTHAHFRLDDPAPLAARLAWSLSRRRRPAAV